MTVTSIAVTQRHAVGCRKTGEAGSGIGGAIQRVTSASVGGVPVWLIAIPILGVVVWLAMRKV